MNRHILPNKLGKKRGKIIATNAKKQIIAQKPLVFINASPGPYKANSLFANNHIRIAVGIAKNDAAKRPINQAWIIPSLGSTLRLNLDMFYFRITF